MTPDSPMDLPAQEIEMKAAFDQGDLGKVATLALEVYGGEILGMLFATCRSPDLAGEAWSQFCEDMWRGLPGFRWGCSLRTWCYRIAHNARNRTQKKPAFQAHKNIALSKAPAAHAAAEKVRTATHAWLKTSVKDDLQRIREGLRPAERELLVLRLDRQLDWREIAIILGPWSEARDPAPDEGDPSQPLPEDSAPSPIEDGPHAPTEAELTTEAARLRKRFQRLKTRLKREMTALKAAQAR